MSSGTASAALPVQACKGEAEMQAAEVQRAIAAARSTVAARDLTVDDAVVLRAANRLVLRLLPCDVVVRVAPLEFRASAALEVELAQQLARTGTPVVPLD